MSGEPAGRVTVRHVIVRHVIVRGRVQGVGYRAFVEGQAAERGLAGWVRNRRDGTVEAVFSGEAEAVEAMIAACREGPPAATVDAVEARDGDEGDLAPRGAREGFVFLPTL